MKADLTQQRSLLELAELDAELARLEHRAAHLPEQAERDRLSAEHDAAEGRLGALRIALDDLDDEISRYEADVDAVRQREDRDRRLLDSGAVDAKQLTDLQHELETLQRRRQSLEDSLLGVMERREELQEQAGAEERTRDTLGAELAEAQRVLEAAAAGIDRTRAERGDRRDTVTGTLDEALLALYERQRGRTGAGAGPLQGPRCGACRIEIDRGELARIAAAADDDVVRCPECGAILLRVQGTAS